MNIYTFEKFWSDFHRVNLIRKKDKDRCRELWKSCNFNDLKRKAIKDICKCDDVFVYLSGKLKYNEN